MVHDPNNLPATIQPNLMDAWGNCHLQGNPDFAMLVLREGAPFRRQCQSQRACMARACN